MNKIIYMTVMKHVTDNYEMISGKIFRKGTAKEVSTKTFGREMFEKLTLQPKEIEDAMKGLALYNQEGFWPELEIIGKAKALKEVPPLPFPLDLKQLVIINRLVFHPTDEAVFITTGIGGSGKSTFLNIIRQLFDNDVANCSLGDLTNDFNVAEAVKHRLIASDELAKGELNLPIIKQLASKQKMMVNPKHMTAYEVQTQSAMFFCCNKAPKLDVTDTGVLRRIIYYERNTKIKNPDPTLNKHVFMEDELLAIAKNALETESIIRTYNDWTDIFKMETHKYIMKDNSVYLLYGRYTYEEYVEGCKEKGLKAYSEPNWREIHDLFTEWINETEKEDLF